MEPNEIESKVVEIGKCTSSTAISDVDGASGNTLIKYTSQSIGLMTSEGHFHGDVNIHQYPPKPPIKLPIWFNVEECSALFCGRKQILTEIQNVLQHKRFVVLSQLPSIATNVKIGKSETVKMYIQLYGGFYKNVIWLNCETAMTLQQDLDTLRQFRLDMEVNIIGTENLVEQILQKIGHLETLVIFDHVQSETLAIVKKYSKVSLPERGGYKKPFFVLTSNMPSIESEFPQFIQLDLLTETEIVDFVLEQLDLPNDAANRQDGIDLGQFADYLPKNLVNAVTFINHQNQETAEHSHIGKFTIKDYMSLQSRSSDDAAINLEDRSWDIIQLKLKEKPNGDQLVQLLETIVLLQGSKGNDRVPLRLLHNFINASNEVLQDKLRVLEQYKLIVVVVDAEGSIAHGRGKLELQVTEIFRTSVYLQSRLQKAIMDSFERSLEQVGPRINNLVYGCRKFMKYNLKMLDVDYMRFVQSMEALLSKSDMLPAMNSFIIFLKHQLAIEYRSMGRLNKSLEIMREVIKFQESELHPNHQDLQIAYINLSGTLSDLGQYKEASSLMDKILTMSTKGAVGDTMKKDDLDLFRWHNQAVLLVRMGRHDEALHILRDVLEKRKKLLGLTDIETLNTMTFIALSLHAQGKHQDALKLLEDIDKGILSYYGGPHPLVADAQNIIGLIYLETGRFLEAIQLYRDIISMHGNSWPYRMYCCKYNLALSLYEIGQYDEALEVASNVYEERLKDEAIGPNHPDAVSSKRLVANLLQKQDRYSESVKMYREVADTELRIYGKEDHEERLMTLGHLAATLEKLGNRQDALELYNFVLKCKRNNFGAHHHKTFEAINNIACIHIGQNHFKEALVMLEDAMKVMGDNQSPYAPVGIRCNLSVVLEQVGRLEEAVTVLAEGVKSHELFYGLRHPRSMALRDNIG